MYPKIKEQNEMLYNVETKMKKPQKYKDQKCITLQ